MKKKLVLTILIVIVLLVTISISYAYFSIIGTNAPQTISFNAGTLSLSFRDNDNGIHQTLNFGETVTKKFTIENDGTREAYATMIFKNMINTYLQGSLQYSLEYSEEENGTYIKVVDARDVPVSADVVDRVIAAGLEIPAGKTYYYKLDVNLTHSDVIDQTSDLGASFDTGFMIEEGYAPIKPKVINERGEEIENGINLLNTIGTNVKIGNEIFYVIGNNNGQIRLLSKYNLDMGELFSYEASESPIDTSQKYYIGYEKQSEHTYYTKYFSMEDMNLKLERMNASLIYLGKATWDEVYSRCIYNGDEVYLALGYIQDNPTMWIADYQSCNDVYELTQNNQHIRGTGLTTADYDYGVQSKCNINQYKTSVMSQEYYTNNYSNGFKSGERIYEGTNIKKYTDSYVNELLKRYGVYTSGDGLTLEDLVNLNCDTTSCSSSDYNYMFLNEAAWINTAFSNNRILTLHMNTISSSIYNLQNAIRPIIIIDSSQFE